MNQMTAGVPTQQLVNTLARNNVKLYGRLETTHTFKDGAVMVTEIIDRGGRKIHNRFFKVSERDIKMGKFVKNKFRYNPSTGVYKLN